MSQLEGGTFKLIEAPTSQSLRNASQANFGTTKQTVFFHMLHLTCGVCKFPSCYPQDLSTFHKRRSRSITYFQSKWVIHAFTWITYQLNPKLIQLTSFLSHNVLYYIVVCIMILCTSCRLYIKWHVCGSPLLHCWVIPLVNPMFVIVIGCYCC